VTLATYNAAQVVLAWGGVTIAAGYADGEFVSADYDADAFSLYIGTDGSGTRSKSNNKSAKFSIRLAQSSPMNDYMSEMHNKDLREDNGGGIMPFLLEDKSGRTLIRANHVWIVKHAPVSMDRGVKERVWPMQTEKADTIVGGNVIVP
jgi:hypothetical protein